MCLKSLFNCPASQTILLSVLFLPMMTSCDNDFDLSNINTDITVGGDLKIPIGETEKLTLSRIIDETDQLYVDETGAYALTTNGSTELNVVKVEEIHIKNFATEPNVVNLHVPLTGSTIVPHLHFDSDVATTLSLDSEQDIPEEVKRIDRLDVSKINARVIVKLLANDMNLMSKLNNVSLKSFTIHFPKEVIFADGIEGLNYDTNVFTTVQPYVFDDNYEMTETFPVVGLVGFPEINDCKIRVVENIDCEGVISADAVNVCGDDFEGFRMTVQFDIPEFDVVKMTGIVDPNINVTPKIIELGELPDIVTDSETRINLNTLSLKVSLENPVGVPFNAVLNLTALDKQQVVINDPVAVNVFIEKAVGFDSSKRADLFITNSETLIAPAGYVKVLVNDLNKLIGKIPEYIKITPDVTVDKTQSHTLTLGRDYSTTVDYALQMPFDFGENSHIVYRESIDDLNADIEDYADKVKSMEIFATAESTLPFEVKLSLTPVDVNGKDMSDRIEYTPYVLLKPGDETAPTQNVEMKFSEKSIGAFQKLDRIDFTVEGNTIAAVSVLKPTQYIKLKMTAHIPDGITITD